MINYNPKLTDQETIDALVNYVRKNGAIRKIAAPKPKRALKTPKHGDVIVMSRVAAAPVTSKVTQGYALKTLKDGGFVR